MALSIGGGFKLVLGFVWGVPSGVGATGTFIAV